MDNINRCVSCRYFETSNCKSCYYKNHIGQLKNVKFISGKLEIEGVFSNFFLDPKEISILWEGENIIPISKVEIALKLPDVEIPEKESDRNGRKKGQRWKSSN